MAVCIGTCTPLILIWLIVAPNARFIVWRSSAPSCCLCRSFALRWSQFTDLSLETMQAILDISIVLQQLRAAGHPKLQLTADDRMYELAKGLPHIRKSASYLQQSLVKWQEQIEAVHSKFSQSEFLSTHQLVAASQLILAGGMCLHLGRLMYCWQHSNNSCSEAHSQCCCCSIPRWILGNV